MIKLFEGFIKGDNSFTKITNIEYNSDLHGKTNLPFTHSELKEMDIIYNKYFNSVYNRYFIKDNNIVRIEDHGISININKIEDEYFYVKYFYASKFRNATYTHYKCDQIAGVINLLTFIKENPIQN